MTFSMRKSNVDPRAEKFLRKLPPKHGGQLARKIEALAENPYPQDSQRLAGYKGVLRVDSGEYRIIYEATDEWVIVWIVGKRNDSDVYKKLRRLLGR